MRVYVNENNEIKDVGSTTDPTLRDIYLPYGMFEGWSTAKVCCYKLYLDGLEVQGYTPYVDTRIIEHIDQLGKQVDAVTPYMDSKRAYIGDSSVTFTEVEGTHITAYCELDNGTSVTTTVERSENSVKVSFDELSDAATVTISAI